MPKGADPHPMRARGARYVAAVTAVVAVAGACATGRASFAAGTLAAAALAFGTLTVASRRGREAIAAGETVRAGAIVGIALAARLLGLAALMVLATISPSVLDLWGVVAGLIASDATLLFLEGSHVRTAV